MKKRVTISMEKFEALIRVETEAREVVAMDPGKHRRLQILALRQALTELHEVRVEEHWPSILPTPKENA